MAGPPAVELESIGKRYGRTLALEDISFAIAPGEMFALLGPNGAGKTTLLHILCTLLRPDSGTARIGGADVVRQALRARRHLGVVFQQSSLDNRLTVEENLIFHGRLYGVPARLRRERIAALLAGTGLEERRNALVQTLSIGMRRRLEIARALLHDADLLVLDEPTVGLDARSREAIWHFIAALRGERSLTMIVTTHYVEEVERADRVCIIDRGRVVALDSPARLKAQHGHEHMRVVPADAGVRDTILARFPDLVTVQGGELILAIPDADFTRAFLAEFGNGLNALAFDRQSLESVFLAVTGRALEVPQGQRPATGRRP